MYVSRAQYCRQRCLAVLQYPIVEGERLPQHSPQIRRRGAEEYLLEEKLKTEDLCSLSAWDCEL